MTTLVEGQRIRRGGSDLYADLTSAPIVEFRADGLVFDGELDEPTATAIRERMTSRDDADQVKRAQLRADRDALADDDPLRRLYNYLLGE